jgi:hypothetical protein
MRLKPAWVTEKEKLGDTVMNKSIVRFFFSDRSNGGSSVLRTLALLFAAALLHGCGGGASTESNPLTTNDTVSTSGYTGPSAQSNDIAEFQLNVWNPLHSANACVACHIEGGQSPQFVRADDINLAYAEALSLVDRDNPANSRLVTKVAGGHNCWLPDVAACETAMTAFISSWVSASSDGGRQIQLVPPVVKTPGATKTFPDDVNTTNFATTVWPVLTANCSGCHVDTAQNAQSPFFASPVVADAYAAVTSKINLNDPALSRLVVRLRDEFHNCWTGSCANDATTMENAIIALSGAIGVNQVQAPTVFSNALTIQDGVPAAGGNRYEDDVIALYEFRTGTGSTILDLSTNTPNSPPLNLTISGDVDWVGGYGIQINNGKAQGSTANSKKLHDLIKATGQYSIEAWVVPANVVQEGPARIISYSASTTARNFTLGQTQYNYNFLQRSSTTDGNGEPAHSTADADEDLQASLQHVVVTFDPVNGRRIYVNGVFTDDVDATPTGNLNDWDDSYAFVLGNEVSNDRQWQGIIRLVAIHNRALTLEQIQQNFAAGVGAKYFLLFGIGGVGGVPAGSYIMMQVEEFDNYSYMFKNPTFINLDPNVVPNSIPIQGLRIGINSKQADVGQAFVNLDATVDAGSYDPATGQVLINLGTIIAQENGANVVNADEFYLTFERLGTATNVVVENPNTTPIPLPDPGVVSLIGLRTFDEINAAMAAVTGVDPADVQASFLTMRQALPAVETIEGFLAAQQMSITQLSLEYCDALVEDATLRSNFFGAFGFTSNVATAFGSGDSTAKNQLVNALYDQMVGLPGTGLDLSDAPVQEDVKIELIGYDAGGTEVNTNSLFHRMSAGGGDQVRTREIVKGMCGAVLGSAALLVQ